MDFLKNLSLDDKDKKHAESSSHPAPPVAVEKEHHGLLGKISDVLHPHDPPPPVVAQPPPPPKHEGLFDKISDAIGGDHGKHNPPPPVVAQAPPPQPKHGLFDKISDAIGGDHGKHDAAPPAPAAKPAVTHESFVDKIGGVLKGDHHTSAPPPPPPEPEHKHLIDKMFGSDHDKPATPPQKKDEGLLGKLGLGHKEEAPPKPQGFGDKLNSMFGGGHAAEKKEDHVDKAVDFVQEHVFKQGDQGNESAIEQLKDKQIADTIRSTLGLKEKHDKDHK